MPLYCVTYDLGEDGDQDYDGLIEAIKSVGPAVEVTDSTWLVECETDGDVWGAINPHVTGPHDCAAVFMVATDNQFGAIGGPGTRAGAAAEWMEQYPPRTP